MTGMPQARSVGEDVFEFGFAVSFASAFGDDELIGIPILDFIFRYGLTDEVDMALRLNSVAMLAIDAKIELADEEDATVAIMPVVGISFAPLVSGKTMSSGTILQLELGILGDYHASEDVTATLGTKYTMWLPTSDGAANHFIGVEGGADIAVSDHIALRPLTAMLFEVGGQGGGFTDILGQFGLGMKYRE